MTIVKRMLREPTAEGVMRLAEELRADTQLHPGWIEGRIAEALERAACGANNPDADEPTSAGSYTRGEWRLKIYRQEQHRAVVNARDPEILRRKLDAVRILWRGSNMNRSSGVVTGQSDRLPPVGSGLYGLPYERLRSEQSPRDIAEGPAGMRDFFWICSADVARIEGARFEIVPEEAGLMPKKSQYRCTKRGTVVGANIGWFGDVNEAEKTLIQEYVTRWYLADLVPRHAFEWQYVVEPPKDPSC